MRTRKPIPVSSSATPITIANVATLSAKNDMLSAVARAVEGAPELFINEHSDVAELLSRSEFCRVGRAVVLTELGGIGILSSTQIERALGAVAEE